MADNDRRGDSSGWAFMFGLLAGTAVGVGLGLLLAPKSGEELRGELGARTRELKNKAAEQYRKAGDHAGDWAAKGRDLADRVRDAAARGVAEAKGYTEEA